MSKEEGKKGRGEEGKKEPSREFPDGWSAQQKAEVVLRPLRGENLDQLSREIQVPACEIEEWGPIFPESGATRLGRRGAKIFLIPKRGTRPRMPRTFALAEGSTYQLFGQMVDDRAVLVLRAE